MNGAIAERTQYKLDDKTLLNVITSGDAAALDAGQKLQYYKARCEIAGLDYRSAPFQFMRLQGREILYAKKEATDQLASKHKVRVEILEQRTETDVRVVHVRAITENGRQTDEIGVVPVGGLKGAELANAYMKAVTKAKRRAILSVCGLGMTDESEYDTLPDAEPVKFVPEEVEAEAQKSPEDTKPAAAKQEAVKEKKKAELPAKPGTIGRVKALEFWRVAKGVGKKSDQDIREFLAEHKVDHTEYMPEGLWQIALSWASVPLADSQAGR